MIHRDIKPANLLLGRRRARQALRLRHRPAVRQRAADRRPAACWAPSNTWPPSRPTAGRSTARADLYSLGGVLYALLARRPPFRAKSLAEMLEKQRTARARAGQPLRPDVPAELEQIIAQLLEKDPEKRIANATVLARRLEAMLHALSLGRTRRARSEREPAKPTEPAAADGGDRRLPTSCRPTPGHATDDSRPTRRRAGHAAAVSASRASRRRTGRLGVPSRRPIGAAGSEDSEPEPPEKPTAERRAGAETRPLHAGGRGGARPASETTSRSPAR